MNKMKTLNIILIIFMFALILNGCEKHEAFKQAEKIIYSKKDYTIEKINANIDIKMNKGYLYGGKIPKSEELDIIPENIKINLSGDIWHVGNNDFTIGEMYVKIDGNEEKAKIELRFGKLYIERNSVTKNIVDLLGVCGLLDYDVKKLFENYADEYEVLSANLSKLDLSYFEKYTERVKNICEIKLNLDIKPVEDSKTSPLINSEINSSELSNNKNIGDLFEIREQIFKDLLSIDGWKYRELNIILSPDNKLNIIGIRENGAYERLLPEDLDYNVSEIIAEIKAKKVGILQANILPMRYIFELFGEKVGWSPELSRPFIKRIDKNNEKIDIIFNAKIIKSKAYVNLEQIIIKGGYNFNIVSNIDEIGEYLEIKLIKSK